MKSPLRLNIVVALAYVALCTVLVLINQQADMPAQGGQLLLNLTSSNIAGTAQ
ncbi:MAG: hypothetical protein H7335_21600 [Massilia sp.]|nr:hypothetical protein [Massilia sp.]